MPSLVNLVRNLKVYLPFKFREEDEDSIGGLGRQIRKLSSRTLEFCDSIDEISASKSKAIKSLNRNQQPSIEVTQPDSEKMQQQEVVVPCNFEATKGH